MGVARARGEGGSRALGARARAVPARARGAPARTPIAGPKGERRPRAAQAALSPRARSAGSAAGADAGASASASDGAPSPAPPSAPPAASAGWRARARAPRSPRNTRRWNAHPRADRDGRPHEQLPREVRPGDGDGRRPGRRDGHLLRRVRGPRPGRGEAQRDAEPEERRAEYREQELELRQGMRPFGALYSGSECVVEQYRASHDIYNSAYAGCFTGGVMARSGGPQGMAMGCATMGALSVCMDKFMDMH